MVFSNSYAPEHLILHLDKAADVVEMVQNAGSIFIGPYSPERCVHLTPYTVPRLLTFCLI